MLVARKDPTQSPQDQARLGALLGRPVRLSDVGDRGFTALLAHRGGYAALLRHPIGAHRLSAHGALLVDPGNPSAGCPAHPADAPTECGRDQPAGAPLASPLSGRLAASTAYWVWLCEIAV